MTWRNAASTFRLSRPERSEDRRGGRVDGEPDEGDHEHPAAEDLRRVVEALDRLPDDPRAHQHERQAVDERREDLRPLEAEAATWARRALGQGQRDEREPDRDDVRDHVAGVREQREAAREHAADDLDDREHQRQDRRTSDERAARGAPVVVRVAVRVASACPCAHDAR